MPTPTVSRILRSNASLPILDQVKGAVASYSLDKIKTNATSPCILSFSDASPNMAVPFANNTFDKASVQNYIIANGGNFATTSAYIQQWTDQSGRGNHATQGTQANQPRILNNGVWETNSNGKLSIQTILATDTHWVVTDSNSLDLTNNGTFSVVHRPTTIGETAGRILDKGAYLFFMGDRAISVAPPGTSASGVGGTVFNELNINTIPFETGTNSLKYYRNGVLVSTVNSSALIPNSNNMYILNNSGLIRQYDGKISELIIFNRTLSDSERKKLEQNQSKRYNIAVS